jgi:hypothetical protein
MKPRVAICAVFKNEGPYLYEWLSFHAFLGVTKFFLYNNNSDDDSVEVINSWPGRASVTLIDWPEIPGQISAYNDMIRNHRDEADWCAFIDCDEFICPQMALNIPTIMTLVDSSASALYVHWRIFGSSGEKARRPGLVTERFTHRAHDSFGPNSIGKSFVRLRYATEVGFCHIVRSTSRMINDASDEIDQSGNGIHSRSSFRLLALNHYFTKSHEEWTRRRSIGKADVAPNDPGFIRDEEEFYRHDQNVELDLAAKKISGEMRLLFYRNYLIDGGIADSANLEIVA